MMQTQKMSIHTTTATTTTTTSLCCERVLQFVALIVQIFQTRATAVNRVYPGFIRENAVANEQTNYSMHIAPPISNIIEGIR